MLVANLQKKTPTYTFKDLLANQELDIKQAIVPTFIQDTLSVLIYQLVYTKG